MKLLYTIDGQVQSFDELYAGTEAQDTELVAQPHLEFSDESSYYLIKCDGYCVRISSSNVSTSSSIISIYNKNNNDNLFTGYCSLIESSSYFQLGYDHLRVDSIIENTPTRVIIKVKGRFDDDAGSSEAYINTTLYNSVYFYIYVDRIVIYVLLDSTTDTLIDSSAGNSILSMNTNSVTNEIGVFESSGSEGTTTVGIDKITDNYVGVVTDELSTQHIDLGYLIESGASSVSFRKRANDNTSIVSFNDGTIYAGTSWLSQIIIFDSIEREGGSTPDVLWSDAAFAVADLVLHDTSGIGYECISAVTKGNSAVTEPGSGSSWTTYWIQCHKYTSTDRLAMGVQYHDIAANTNLIDIVDTMGSLVTDMVVPKTIDASEAFATDGAYQVDLDSTDHDAKVDFDQTEHNPVMVLQDPSIRTGDGSTEHCVLHLKCDDNAASSTVVASIGSNANWENYSDASDRNTNTSGDSISLQRGTGLDTQNGSGYLDLSLTEWPNALLKKGTLMIQMAPQFSYDVASSQIPFALLAGTDNIKIRYTSSSDYFYAIFEWGGVVTNLILTEHTSNDRLTGVSRCFVLSWDSDYDYICVADFDERITDSKSDIPVSTTPTKVCIGSDATRSTSADIQFDEIKVYNACILSVGTYISAQHIELDDYTDAHSDITFYWDGSNCTLTDVAIGGVQGTLGSANTGGTTSFVTTGGPAGTGYFDNESNSTNYGISFPVTNNDIVDPNFCSISFWWYIPTWAGYDRIISLGGPVEWSMYLGTATNTGKLEFAFRNTVPTSFDETSDDGVMPVASWAFIKIHIDTAKGGGRVYVNDVLEIELTNFTGNLNSVTIVGVGHDSEWSNNINAYMYGLTITNDPNTPELPFVLGHGPVVVPKLYES